jgi:integrase
MDQNPRPGAWTALHPPGHRQRPADPLSTKAIENIVKRGIAAAGIDARDYSPHSLRSGIITAAGIAGVNPLLIQSHVGHKSAESTSRYFRPSNLFRSNPAGLIGL